MSEMESLFWHTLGYAAMPAIFIAGFVMVALVAVGILSLTKDKK